MSEEPEAIGTTIYVMPTEEGKPPRALYGPVIDSGEGAMALVNPLELQWSRDSGCWMSAEGIPAPADLSEAITEHARELGVEEFQS